MVDHLGGIGRFAHDFLFSPSTSPLRSPHPLQSTWPQVISTLPLPATPTLPPLPSPSTWCTMPTWLGKPFNPILPNDLVVPTRLLRPNNGLYKAFLFIFPTPLLHTLRLPSPPMPAVPPAPQNPPHTVPPHTSLLAVES
jgi:hypothetical protein